MKKFLLRTFIAFSIIFIIMFCSTMIIEYNNKQELNSEVNVQIQMTDGKIEIPDTPPKVQANYEFSKLYFFSSIVIGLVTPILFYKFGGIQLIKKKNYKNKLVEGTVLVVLYSIFSEILIVSKVFFSSFYRARLVGLSNQTLIGFIQDYLKEMLIEFIIALPVLIVIYIIYLKKKRWYIYCAVFAILVSIATTYLYPYIDQIQNELTVIEDGSLKTKIKQLAKDAGIEDLDIRVIEKSTETTSMNAYMTGIGDSRRIVFWDTTLKGMNENEILSIAAHEIGHYKKNHIPKSIALSAIGILICFILIDRVMKKFKGDDYRKLDYIPHIIFLVNILVLIATPIETAYSRANELEADKFAIELTNDSYTNGELEIRFINSNLSPIDVNGLYKWLAYDHPTTRERIELSNEWETN